METRSKVSGGSEPLKKKEIGAAKRQMRHPKISNFSACKAQENQHEITIAFFERDYVPNVIGYVMNVYRQISVYNSVASLAYVSHSLT